MIGVLLFVLFLFLVLIGILALVRRAPVIYVDPIFDDGEDVATTTRTKTVVTTAEVPASEPAAPSYVIVGELKRNMANTANSEIVYSVTDPVDNTNSVLDPTWDLYEDAAGKIWKLV